MARVKRGVTAHARHKKVLELAKGYRGRSHSSFRIAIEKVEKGLQYAYRDRRNKKRSFRALWIVRINAGVREAIYHRDLLLRPGQQACNTRMPMASGAMSKRGRHRVRPLLRGGNW